MAERTKDSNLAESQDRATGSRKQEPRIRGKRVSAEEDKEEGIFAVKSWFFTGSRGIQP